MSAQERFFEELQRAITRGFTLAAVSASMACGTASMNDAGPSTGGGSGFVTGGGGGSGGGGSSGGGGGTMTFVPRDFDGGGALGAVPPGSLQCTGDAGFTGPFYGSCCTAVHCYPPTSERCAAPNAIGPHTGQAFTPALPPGSGTCMCGQTQGPYAQADGGDTECCYVVGKIGCDGRPLREGEVEVVARVVVRSDWA